MKCRHEWSVFCYAAATNERVSPANSGSTVGFSWHHCWFPYPPVSVKQDAKQWQWVWGSQKEMQAQMVCFLLCWSNHERVSLANSGSTVGFSWHHCWFPHPPVSVKQDAKQWQWVWGSQKEMQAWVRHIFGFVSAVKKFAIACFQPLNLLQTAASIIDF